MPSKQLVGKLGARLGQGRALSRSSCEHSVGSLGLGLLRCSLCCWGTRLLPWFVFTQPSVALPRLSVPMLSRYQIKIPPRCLKSSHTAPSRTGRSVEVTGPGWEVNSLSLAQCQAKTAVCRNLILFGFLRGSNWEYRMSGDKRAFLFSWAHWRNPHTHAKIFSQRKIFFFFFSKIEAILTVFILAELQMILQDICFQWN